MPRRRDAAMLSELTASTRRLALVGLAKNTGKTETLAVLLRELASSPEGGAKGRRVGVTSVGRDGEERDVIDSRIAKPRVRLCSGSLVATTDGLLRASAIPHQLLETTDVRTPLGRVLIARLLGAGAIEVAGPSAATDVRAVSDAMLAHGAEQVLIDGAVDRRAASSPAVSDGVVMATGAVLDQDVARVVQETKDAVELLRLPLVDEDCEPFSLPSRFALTAEAEQIARLLDEHPRASALIVPGALPERFLQGLLQPLRYRRRTLALVVADPTRVFLSRRSAAWYGGQGVRLQTLERIELEAITVNPIAPQAHRFDSVRLRALLQEAILDTPIFDVLHPDYAGMCDASPVAAAS
jgi:hypothetical protein